MQTFLPYSDYTASARVLDRARLGCQRLEGKDALYVCYRHAGVDVADILGLTEKQTSFIWRRYRHHPAAMMWIDHEQSLARYCIAICDEWIARGYVDNQRRYFVALLERCPIGSGDDPVWLGDEDFHRSHRSNLLRKMPEHYRRYWPDERDDLPYVWPNREEVRKDGDHR